MSENENGNENQNNSQNLLRDSQEGNNYTEITFQVYLNEKEKKENKKFYNGGGCCSCCRLGIIGNLIYIIIICVICIVLAIGSKITTYKNNKEYSDLREFLLMQMELNTTENDILNYLPFNYKKFFCNIVYWEDPFLMFQIVIFIIYLIFIIINLYTFNTFIKKQIKAGFIHTLFVFFNYLFYYCFKFQFIFFIPILAWATTILNISFCYGDLISNKECNTWMKKRYSSCGKHVGMFNFLFLFGINMIKSSKKIYILLLGMKYDKETSNNMERIKPTSLKIGGRCLEIDVKINKNIYLESQNDKILFKQILLKKNKILIST